MRDCGIAKFADANDYRFDITVLVESQKFRNLAILFLIDGKAFLLPLVKTTQKCNRVFDTFCFETDHRTGGRMFVWSRTVRDYRLVFRQFIQMLQNICRRNQFRARNVTGIK